MRNDSSSPGIFTEGLYALSQRGGGILAAIALGWLIAPVCIAITLTVATVVKRFQLDTARHVWPSSLPMSVPFKSSDAIAGIVFTGRFASHTNGDTWYPAWGADDVLYSPYVGRVTGGDGKSVYAQAWPGPKARTGRAAIVGDDPLALKIAPLSAVPAWANPYGGRYPSASLIYNGIWYVGTYTLDDRNGASCGNWCTLGPFVGFHWSPDRGQTWHAPGIVLDAGSPLFEPRKDSSNPIKFGAPHFVDFGQNMRHSPDGNAYLVAHGSSQPGAHNNWIAGDQIFLARVRPSPTTINDAKAWEFYAGNDSHGRPRWTHRFSEIRPILEWRDHLGCVAVTYDAPLRKYLMFVSHGWPSVGPFDTIVLEADSLTSSWRLVSYLKDFGPQAYFVNAPSKFISADGRTLWLFYSANFSGEMAKAAPNPEGSGHGLHLIVQQVQLLATN